MEDRRTSFLTQADALMRKNITFQKRNLRTNVCLVTFPILLSLLLLFIQRVAYITLSTLGTHTPEDRCSCNCTDTYTGGSCSPGCVTMYFDQKSGKLSPCPIPSPRKWPALMQIPNPEFRATRSNFSFDSFADLPDESCKETGTCPVITLITGGNRYLAESLGENLFAAPPRLHSSDDKASSNALDVSAEHLLGTVADPPTSYFFEGAFLFGSPLYIVQPHCDPDFKLKVFVDMGGFPLQQGVECIRGLNLWRTSSSVISNELYTGYRNGNSEKRINEFLSAYDFLNTDENKFNATVSYNGSYGIIGMIRVSRSLNAASNSYLEFFKGDRVKMLLEFISDMPKAATPQEKQDVFSLLGPLFFSWVINLLLPVMLENLIYEKQQNLRMIMKMHGLGNGPYWMISYAYFLLISSVYMLCFVVFGSVIGLRLFRLNDYSVQFVFYFVYINLQIVLAFFGSTIFSNVKTAIAIAYIYVFTSGLLGAFLFQHFLEDESFSRESILAMEVFPGFSLYRGLYELSQNTLETQGMSWKDINSIKDGMGAVLAIMVAELFILLPVAYFLDQITSFGCGIRKYQSSLFQKHSKRGSLSIKNNLQGQRYNVINAQKPDISQERELVEKLLTEPRKSHAIICDELKLVYPGTDGSPKKHAVLGLSLAVAQGECFGMLGPNGAGKTSVLNMMTGLATPTSGTAFVQGLDIMSDMDKVYYKMGVCPQHDLIWEMLTGREHLLFYGRLKNLKGAELKHAVEESLRSVNLFYSGVADKRSGTYSGGMKRRLSVAISLIGNPQVVYMDEPSTGLDPVSRNDLWKVVRQTKQDKAIILTTHSMEEAEVLCDRVGIFVDGDLQCLGNPKELKARFGGYYMLTVTTSTDQETEVEKLVRQLSPSAKKRYHISNTQKFELPKQEVRIADVFQAVDAAKRKFKIHAWGLADTTLEDVFIKVAKGE